ncbi:MULTISPECIES: hypothetical protein [Pseudomonas]|uniref:hypothetical protein n=1 Tax=Pseudomonas TaxID=286 RepID=UPI0004D5DA9F|nr:MULTISPECIES: hypothetical protein [Pseudomonas]KES25560.1 hypothetical protein FG99_05450 [Pseudomonas sp. AAC]WAB89863.1 hypothetical protein OSS47_17040 [Pseudomonas citronellolis]
MAERPWRLATLPLCGLLARGAQAGPAAPPPLDGPGGSRLAHADLRSPGEPIRIDEPPRRRVRG